MQAGGGASGGTSSPNQAVRRRLERDVTPPYENAPNTKTGRIA